MRALLLISDVKQSVGMFLEQLERILTAAGCQSVHQGDRPHHAVVRFLPFMACLVEIGANMRPPQEIFGPTCQHDPGIEVTASFGAAFRKLDKTGMLVADNDRIGMEGVLMIGT